MKISIGTIHELTGTGYEVLVDVATRTKVLGYFFDGNFIRTEAAVTLHPEEPTLLTLG